MNTHRDVILNVLIFICFLMFAGAETALVFGVLMLLVGEGLR